MKFTSYATYNTTPLGFHFGKWNFGTQHFGVCGNNGWFISLTIPTFKGRYQFQLRHDVYVN